MDQEQVSGFQKTLSSHEQQSKQWYIHIYFKSCNSVVMNILYSFPW